MKSVESLCGPWTCHDNVAVASKCSARLCCSSFGASPSLRKNRRRLASHLFGLKLNSSRNIRKEAAAIRAHCVQIKSSGKEVSKNVWPSDQAFPWISPFMMMRCKSHHCASSKCELSTNWSSRPRYSQLVKWVVWLCMASWWEGPNAFTCICWEANEQASHGITDVPIQSYPHISMQIYMRVEYVKWL